MLFTPSEDVDINLQHEGIPKERTFHVGNGMIDSLVRLLPAAMQCARNSLPERYALVDLCPIHGAGEMENWCARSISIPSIEQDQGGFSLGALVIVNVS
jgi:UDP-N-acetylglucosamine 2-epimerase